MNPVLIIITGISLAFCYVNYINPKIITLFSPLRPPIFYYKPFTCETCMSGWFSLILGLILYGWLGFIYLPMGVFFGAMANEIRMNRGYKIKRK